MRSSLSIVMCTALFLNGLGQYTYFNELFGSSTDQASQFETCIELLDSTWYTWGGGVNGQFFNSAVTYSDSGTLQDEAIWSFPESLVYLGETNSFQKIPDENAFLFSQAMEDVNGSHGLLMKIDSNLDTLWTSLVDIYPGETSIITHTWDEDGFLLAGEHRASGVGNGTFIAKVDSEGQYLWHTILHSPDEGVFRNTQITAIEEGIILTGGEVNSGETEGQIEFYNAQNESLSTLVNNETAILRGTMSHLVRSNGDIIVTQPIRVTDYPGAVNPQFAYAKSNLYRLDLDLLELELLGEYDGGGEWITGGIVKTIESSQDGLVQLGRTYLEIDDSLRQVSFIMKLTEDYQVDWYTELSYEICSGCNNELYDIEQSPDGGYVMVGKFNSPEDPYDKTWLVKVDACGDLEWQGCAPVGIGEFEIQSSSDGMKLAIWPNPYPAGSSAPLGVHFLQEVIVEKVVMVDARGRIIPDSKFKACAELGRSVQGSYSDNLESAILNLEFLAPGLYSLLITTRDGAVCSGKLVIE